MNKNIEVLGKSNSRHVLPICNIRCHAVSLYGQHSGQYQPTFKRFMLVVEPSSNSPSSGEDSAFSDQKVGSFTLMGTSMAQFSSHCPNSIIQMSTSKRTEVSVKWTAPPPGSGCVVFRYKNHFIYFPHKDSFL